MKRAILLTLMIGVFCTIGRTAVGCEWIEACGVSPAEVCKGTSQLFWGYGKGTLYVWKFGDGQSANAPVISHTYSNPGAFRATFEITDTVKCGHTVRAYVTATARALTEFSPKPGIFPKCVNAGVSRDDFTITTTPSGYENDVVFSAPDGTSQAGTFQATATYCNDQKTADYTVVGSDTWVSLSGTIPPPSPSGQITGGPTEKTQTIEYQGKIYNVKVVVTYAGPTNWSQIGRGEVTAPAVYTTEQSSSWSIGGSVTGQITVGCPWLGGSISTTVSGNWENSTSHSLTSGPDSTPYLWRYTHYQNVWIASQTAQSYVWIESQRQWLLCETQGPTGVGSGGLEDYKQMKERKCP